jgi:hypothetical protein
VDSGTARSQRHRGLWDITGTKMSWAQGGQRHYGPEDGVELMVLRALGRREDNDVTGSDRTTLLRARGRCGVHGVMGSTTA